MSVTEALPQADAIVASLSSLATCSASTVTALQSALGTKAKVNTPPATTSKSAPTTRVRARATTVTKATSKTRTTTKTTAVIEVLEDEEPRLSPKEQLRLATDAYNACIKSLTEAIKAQREQSPLTKKVDAIPKHVGHSRTSSSPASLRMLTRTPSLPNGSQLVQPLSKITNSPSRRSSLRRSSSYSQTTRQGPDTAILAIADCARTATAHLRANGDKSVSRQLGAFQVETAMLALIGKLLALGLESHAVKELRLLKKRLEVHMKKEEARETSSTLATGKAVKEQDTIVTLLCLPTPEGNPSVLPLVSKYQSFVLQVIARSRRPQVIEAIVPYLETDCPSSPVSVGLQQAQNGTLDAKPARDLEAFARTILSLCPSPSSEKDAAAADHKTCASPEVVLKLQSLAFEARLKWWRATGHRGDVVKEIIEPLNKCILAFSRRSVATVGDKYELVVGCWKMMDALTQTTEIETTSFPATISILRTLSILAQAAGLTDDAIRWIKTARAHLQGSSASEAASVACDARLASLLLENTATEREVTAAGRLCESVLQSLEGGLKGDSADLDALLTEMMALRKRVTVKVAAPTNTSNLHDFSNGRDELYQKLLSASAKFLVRYLGSAPPGSADARVVARFAYRREAVKTHAPATIDSVLIYCKLALDLGTFAWDSLDTALQTCLRILSSLEEYAQPGSPSASNQSYVKISNIYWAIYLKQANTDDSDRGKILSIIRRSTNVLRGRGTAEQEAGFLALKLERLGSVYESGRHFSNAQDAYGEAVQLYIHGDLPSIIADFHRRNHSRAVWEAEGQISMFGRCISSFQRMLLRKDNVEEDQQLILDDESLHVEARAAILEWQFLQLIELAFSGKPISGVKSRALDLLASRLFSLYTSDRYPLRRLRVALLLLHVATDGSVILQPDLLRLAEESRINQPVEDMGEDSGLCKVVSHYVASFNISMALKTTPPNMEKIKVSLSAWEDVVDTTPSWQELVDRVDDIALWRSQLLSISDLCDAQGDGVLRAVALRVLVRLAELENATDPSSHIAQLSALGLQYLRLGYSGKAGLTLAKAQSLVKVDKVPAPAKLQWSLAYAEYLLDIGNLEKCQETLLAAEKLAETSNVFTNDQGGSSTFKKKLDDYRLIADGAFVYSKHQLEVGQLERALYSAKQSVKLNQRVWVMLENDRSHSRAVSQSTEEIQVGALTDAVSQLQISKPAPPAVSLTHEALNGPAFWSLVPALFRSLSHLARIYEHLGNLQDAVYYTEQAQKVAKAVNAPALLLQNSADLGGCWIKARKAEKAEAVVGDVNAFSERQENTKEKALFEGCIALLHRLNGETEEEEQAYERAEQILKDLTSLDLIDSLDRSQPPIKRTIQAESKAKTKPRAVAARAPAARSKVGTARTTTKVTARKPQTQPQPDRPSASEECSRLLTLQGDVMRSRAVLLLLQQKLDVAADLITRADQFKIGSVSLVQQQLVVFRKLVMEATKEMTSDFTFHVLPESSISFPALGRGERRPSLPSVTALTLSSSQTVKANARSAHARGQKTEAAVKEDFAVLLKRARDCILEVQSVVLQSCSTSVVHQVYSVLSHITILLSATNPAAIKGTLHPVFAAWSLELPRTCALQRDYLVTQVDKVSPSTKEYLVWPKLNEIKKQSALATATVFQKEYVDIIPSSWTAISLCLNDSRDELYVTRYNTGETPFILRLPMARHGSRDMDETEAFGFEEGRAELQEIIDLSNFSCHNTGNIKDKGAKTAWWDEREALDNRLRDLLVNIENIWLGGFKGIFSQHPQNQTLLARFQRNLQNIINRHLPSRRGKGKAKPVNLDRRVLELFIGLGDATDETIDLDEPLADLLYFVVDILQFNGERNAYDEIDFDAMAVETIDALRSCHSSASKTSSLPQHTILILDKQLHAFPWESLPCLQGLSVSRLPSLGALRDRILDLRTRRHAKQPENGVNAPMDLSQASDEDATSEERYLIPRTQGTYILNPSSDLTTTETLLSPPLSTLPNWTGLTRTPPTETTFTLALTTSPCVLYFGHGSGAQYIRPRSIKRLDRCAVTLLMGCSSGLLADNGEFEPSGVVWNYVVNGCAAVVATLWDVTDKDIDRFSVRGLEEWGMFERGAAGDLSGGGRRRGKGSGGEDGGRKARGRGKGRDVVEEVVEERGKESLVGAVAKARSACYLRYLNGAAPVVYGIPVYLEDAVV